MVPVSVWLWLLLLLLLLLRLILSHRSTFFRSMLDNEARSVGQVSYSDSNSPLSVVIHETTKEVFTEIVRYLYSGHGKPWVLLFFLSHSHSHSTCLALFVICCLFSRSLLSLFSFFSRALCSVELTSDILIPIITLAKVYQLTDLVNMLSPTIADALDVNNVCDILNMATSSEMLALKEQCMVYFQRHKNKIFLTDSYQRLKTEAPALGMTILEEMHSREPIGWYWANPTMCPKEADEL